MKKFIRSLITAVLSWQVRRLYKRASFKTVVVAGSIGKTSTKFAVAALLNQKYKVLYQTGNYNTAVSVPLVFFGQTMPALLNPFGWLATFFRIERSLHRPFPYDVVLIEAGTDQPGDIPAFAKYLHADLGVLTAIVPEHMEFFADLDAVAREELAVATFADQLLVNADLCDPKYLGDVTALTYGVAKHATYWLRDLHYQQDGFDFVIEKEGKPFLVERHASVAQTQIFSIVAAIAVADQLGLDTTAIRQGIAAIQPVSGRMQRLAGIHDSIILDDTYNASPEATKAALATLYRLEAPHKIAILGNMNELGAHSQTAHTEIGACCDPKQLDLVVTIGPDANQYLAPAAETHGCKVRTFDSPYAAGAFVKDLLQPGTLILAKGSQNGIFAEEAVKQLLANPADASKLVRQNKAWIAKKRRAFDKVMK
jgi:UDP-N-acetylmuramoyl-tripeptide--D-alanyl-D-alanine ligase